jgi:hypothetical protein
MKQDKFLGKKLFEYSASHIPVFLWILLRKEPENLEESLNYFEKQLAPLINLFL